MLFTLIKKAMDFEQHINQAAESNHQNVSANSTVKI